MAINKGFLNKSLFYGSKKTVFYAQYPQFYPHIWGKRDFYGLYELLMKRKSLGAGRENRPPRGPVIFSFFFEKHRKSFRFSTKAQL
jgi:hypothetical protein